MKKPRFVVLIIILVLFEAVALDYLKLFSTKPDLLLAMVLIWAIFLRPTDAFKLGVLAGFLKDLFSENIFGINTLLFPCWVWVSLQLSKRIAVDNHFIRMLLLFILSILTNIVYRLVMLSMGIYIPWVISLRIIILSSFYTACLLPILLKITYPLISIRKR
ncbi:MAG: rod shape-determining protein MreD [Candidatus Omnitrophica bacterium]|nr:rod shape-determining protein MreD [Candidatus Omnitrophota bacterium]